MKHPLILPAVAALLSMSYCTQPQPPQQNKQDKKVAYKINLQHKQDLIFKGTSSAGGSASITLEGFPVDSSSIEYMRKKEPSYPIKGSPYDHVKIILRDHITGEEELLAEK